MATIPVKIKIENVLKYLGSLYRNPADAIKEYVSNAIDAFLEYRCAGDCIVKYELLPKSISITYNSPGISEKDLKSIMSRVADSAKSEKDISQIGSLGIGLWAFQQVGRKAAIFSKPDNESDTFKFILKEGSDNVEIKSATSAEKLSQTGMKIIITELKVSTIKRNSPVSAQKLSSFFAYKFDHYLRDSFLKIRIVSNGVTYSVAPMKINLPEIARSYSEQYISGDRQLKVALTLWFEPSGKGRVCIRHSGVSIIDDLSAIDAYGLESSVLGKGKVHGYIDANCLTPLPARTGFEDNRMWTDFLDLLDRLCHSIQSEVSYLEQQSLETRTKQIYDHAIDLAQQTFAHEELRHLELIGGLVKPHSQPAKTGTRPSRGRTGLHKKDGEKASPTGMRISIQEYPFEDGPNRLSRFETGVVKINTLNPHFQREMAKTEKDRVHFIACLIGKEILAFNDKTRMADDLLEKSLIYYLLIKEG